MTLGYFDDAAEAARAFDEAARRLRGDEAHGGRGGVWRLNFPTEVEAAASPDEPQPLDEEAIATAEATVTQRLAAGQPASRYAGVVWAKSKRRWTAQIRHEGWTQYLGLSLIHI